MIVTIAKITHNGKYRILRIKPYDFHIVFCSIFISDLSTIALENGENRNLDSSINHSHIGAHITVITSNVPARNVIIALINQKNGKCHRIFQSVLID
jgi:hypothetical protein